eukprot:INCI11126.1.p1 GENE.INCI11126.1~~INCI11126.1.p1  ORF type:complete len:419 (-),score=72.06 INCI11126.1:728-1984(-)
MATTNSSELVSGDSLEPSAELLLPMNDHCACVEALFVERRFDQARDCAQHFFERFFAKKQPNEVTGSFSTARVDLSARSLTPKDEAIARVAAVLLQCSYELDDPEISEYVTAVYREARTEFPYDLGLIWVRLQLLRLGTTDEMDATALESQRQCVQAVVEESLRQTVRLVGTNRFDYEKYRSFVAILVHDLLHKWELQQCKDIAINEDDLVQMGDLETVEGKGAEDGQEIATSTTAAAVVEKSVLSVVDKERFRSELAAERFCLGVATPENDSSLIPNNVETLTDAGSSSHAGGNTKPGADASMGNEPGGAIQSDAIAALDAAQQSQQLSMLTSGRQFAWHSWLFFESAPVPRTPPWTGQFWLAIAAQAAAWLQHFKTHVTTGAVQRLAIPLGIVVLVVVLRKSVIQVLRRFAQELRT